MGRHPEPLERQMAKAKGNGRTPGNREIAVRVELPSSPASQARDLPTAPRGLGRRGKLEWRKIWEAGIWMKPDQDYAWVEQVARAYDDIDTFRKRVEQDGLVQFGSQGQPVAHPLVAEIRKCEQTIRQCLSVLGFSPSDRARLGIAEVQRQKGLQDLINAAGKRASG